MFVFVNRRPSKQIRLFKIKITNKSEMFKTKRRNLSIYVLQKKCIGCESCIDVCPHKVFGMIYKDNDSYATVEYPDKCSGCGRCVKYCPVDAIELTKE